MKDRLLKYISFFVAAVILLSALVSCGGGEIASDDKTETEQSEENTNNAEDVKSEDELWAEMQEAQSSFSYGTYTESAFENEWLNLKFTAPSGLLASPETDKQYNEAHSDEEGVLLMSFSSGDGCKVTMTARKLTGYATDAECLDSYAESVFNSLDEDGYLPQMGEKGSYKLCGASFVTQAIDTETMFGKMRALVLSRIHDGWAVQLCVYESGGYSLQDLLIEFENVSVPDNQFRIMVVDGDSQYSGGYLDSYTELGTTMNEAVYERTQATEKECGVVIAYDRMTIDEYNADVYSGSVDYDAIYAPALNLGSVAVSGSLGDLRELSSVDLSAEYWYPSAAEDLTVAGKQFMALSDISMSSLDYADCLLYNAALGAESGVETSFGSPGEMVIDGKWTIDTYLSMVSAASKDLDGDGSILTDDIYGMIDSGSGERFAGGAGIRYATNTGDGLQLFAINDSFYDLAAKISGVYSDSRYVKTHSVIYDETGKDAVYYANALFAEDHALFMAASPAILKNNTVGAVSNNIMILPLPKYNAEQDGYCATVDCNSYAVAYPSSVRGDCSGASFERTGKVLDSLARNSGEHLLSAYVDAVSERCCDAALQNEVLLKIREGIRFDITSIASCSSTASGGEIGTIAARMFASPGSMSTTYRSQQAKLQKMLSDYYDSIARLP